MAAGLIARAPARARASTSRRCASTGRASAGRSARSRSSRSTSRTRSSTRSALAIRTPLGVVVHTGDFKIDQTPIDGRAPDLQRASPSTARAACCCCSPTRPTSSTPASTPSERSVRGGLEQHLPARPTGAIFFSTFSSHIHRMQQVHRPVASATGRAWSRRRAQPASTASRIATRPRLPARAAGALRRRRASSRRCRRSEVTLLTSGSQGEPLSALTRIAMDDHKQVQMEPGDAVDPVVAHHPRQRARRSRNMVNHLYRRGAQRAITARDADVHVSGHASQDELALMLNLVRPRYFVPVHGEYRHLVRHIRAGARGRAWREDAAFLLEDGDVLEIDARRRAARRAGHRRAASSSTARASATSATSSCATAATSRRTASCSPCSRIDQQTGELDRRARPRRRAASSPRTTSREYFDEARERRARGARRDRPRVAHRLRSR